MAPGDPGGGGGGANSGCRPARAAATLEAGRAEGTALGDGAAQMAEATRLERRRQRRRWVEWKRRRREIGHPKGRQPPGSSGSGARGGSSGGDGAR